nr:DUF2306 domain-containing protein [uncultured Undibacterium sp.]
MLQDTVNPPLARADRLLKCASVFSFAAIAVGQLIFILYIILFYVQSAFSGRFEAWNKVLPRGYVAGDTVGNTMTGSHIFLAVAIMLCGLIQLIPTIRQHAPRLHHWSGRFYVISCVLTSLVGLYMVWTYGRSNRLFQHLGISLDAVLIIVFAALTIKYAIARKFTIHRRWALRLFMAASAVWFFRIGLMFWIFIHKGPVGFDVKTFSGPFLSFLSFADYLIPLALLEIYFRAKDGSSVIFKLSAALLIVVASLAMCVGIFVASMGLWLPRMF